MTPGKVVLALIDDGRWSASFGISLRNLFLYDAAGERHLFRSPNTDFRKIAGPDGISSGRNELTAKFLDDTDGEWLWFVDADMGFDQDTLERLVKSADPLDRPVMGALCFAQRGVGAAELQAHRWLIQPTLYEGVNAVDEVGFRAIIDYPLNEIVEVAGTGAACLLIHRSVLEAIREHAGDAWFTHVTHPTGDHGKPRRFSEDLSFCIKVASAGSRVHVDTAIKTSHDKGGIFLDEEMFARQQAFSAFEKQLGLSSVMKVEGDSGDEPGLRDAG